MASTTSHLESVINHVESDQCVTAFENGKSADNELEKIYQNIDPSVKLELKALREFMKQVINRQPRGAKVHVSKAREVFNTHIKPYLEDRHAQSKQSNPPTPISYAESNTYQNKQGSIGNSEQRDEENRRKPRNDSGQKAQPGHVQKTTQHRLVRGHQNDSAKPNRQWTPEQIADGFMEIYNENWTDAYEQVKKHGKDEKTIYAFLLKIVEEAYKNSRHEADEQIKQMENCARQIVMGNNTEPPKHLLKTDASLLKQYRKDHAGVSVKYIQQNFVDKILPRIHTDLKLQRADVIDVYAGLCVEITWWMTVQDPPVYMVCGDKGKDFNEKIYEPIIKSGKRVNYIIWPPLLLYKDGPVLQRGKAVGQ